MGNVKGKSGSATIQERDDESTKRLRELGGSRFVDRGAVRQLIAAACFSDLASAHGGFFPHQSCSIICMRIYTYKIYVIQLEVPLFHLRFSASNFSFY